MATMADRFRAAREAAGLTQTLAATRSGVSVDRIRKIEQGRTRVRGDELVRLAGAYAVDVTDLIGSVK